MFQSSSGPKTGCDRRLAAATDAAEAVRLDPKDANACQFQVDVNRIISTSDRIIATCSQTISFEQSNEQSNLPSSPEVVAAVRKTLTATYALRGLSYLRKGNLDNAIADLSEAIRLDPNNASVYCDRSHAYERKGNLNKAKADIEQAEKLQSSK